MSPMPKYATVDDYIADQSPKVQKLLKQIRQIIKKAAPDAEEKISYGIPYYGLNGRLVYFAAFQNHIGFYPMKSSIKHFKKELAGYPTSAGTVRFGYDKPLPLDLIKRIVEFRAQENFKKN